MSGFEDGFPYTQEEFVGIDVGQEDGDKSVMVRGIPDGKGGFRIIAIDEFSTMPDYKWYRNPIKWYKWRKLWKVIEVNAEKQKRHDAFELPKYNEIYRKEK